MTLLQAAARNSANSAIAHVLTRPTHGRSANESANDNGANAAASQLVFEEALRHFAKHGLGAATDACETAETAFHSGDMDTYNHWLAICRTLDRRLARQFAQMLEAS